MFLDFFLHVHYTYAYVHTIYIALCMYLFWSVWLCSWLTDRILHQTVPCGTTFVFFRYSWLLLFPTVLHILYGSRYFRLLLLHCRHCLLSKWQSSNSTNSHDACRAFARPRLPCSRQRCWSLQLSSQMFVFASNAVCSLLGGLEVVHNWHWNLAPNKTAGFVGRFHQMYQLLVPFLLVRSISLIQSLQVGAT